MLRFDFTGLGSSEGEFANTNFTSNVDDLVAAADMLRDRYEAPRLLIGHSLGGAAVLAACSPDPRGHGRRHRSPHPPTPPTLPMCSPATPSTRSTRRRGRGRARRPTVPHPTPVPRRHRCPEARRRRRHAWRGPARHALAGRQARRCRPRPTHLRKRPAPEELLSPRRRRPPPHQPRPTPPTCARVLATWASRYLPQTAITDAPQPPNATKERSSSKKPAPGRSPNRVRRPPRPHGRRTHRHRRRQRTQPLRAAARRARRLHLDDPAHVRAPPKGLPLDHVTVSLSHERTHSDDCADPDTAPCKIDRISRRIEITGDLTDDQPAARLSTSPTSAPVHRTLEGDLRVSTTLSRIPAN